MTTPSSPFRWQKIDVRIHRSLCDGTPQFLEDLLAKLIQFINTEEELKCSAKRFNVNGLEIMQLP